MLRCRYLLPLDTPRAPRCYAAFITAAVTLIVAADTAGLMPAVDDFH